MVEAGVEECDDGNLNSDNCLVDCRNAGCGDGQVHAGVGGVTTAMMRTGTAVRLAATTRSAVMGLFRSGLECDDGNQDNTDACIPARRSLRGWVVQNDEECDDGPPEYRWLFEHMYDLLRRRQCSRGRRGV